MVAPGAVLVIERGQECVTHPKAIQPGDQRQKFMPRAGGACWALPPYRVRLQDFRRPLTPSLSPSDGERIPRNENSGVETPKPRENIERPTSNNERRSERGVALPFDVRSWMFDVGCSSGFMGRVAFRPGEGNNVRKKRGRVSARTSLDENALTLSSGCGHRHDRRRIRDDRRLRPNALRAGERC